ncbi:MAG: nitroreductase family protein [Thermoanaerobaculales bacterium]|nr:nitroreductase family protein [Thermoanaerobaculales bacterium]
MNDQLHVVDLETCNGDGICAEVCPENALELVNEKAATVESRAGSCLYCGQCVAVCPTESLQMPKLEMEDFRRLQKRPFGYDEFHEFLRLRRSVRVFKDQPIERSVIEKVLEAAATAPMGFPPHTTEVVVIDDRAELDFLLEELVREYDSMIKAFSTPIGRAMVRLRAGAEDYLVLKDHVLENVQLANELFHNNGTDRYMYRAPVLMMFHGSRWGISFEENAHLVCHHAMLAAVSLGLGTTIIGLISPVVDRSKNLRERYGIPKDNRVLTSLILGHPKYKYRQGIRRKLAGVTFH